MKLTEILIKNDKKLPKETFDLVIKADKMVWYETFYPYPIPSDENFEYELLNHKSHFYYVLAHEESELIGTLKIEITIGSENQETPFTYEGIPYVEMTVNKNHRGKGIAKHLAKYFSEHFPYTYETLEYHIRTDREIGLDSFFQNLGAKMVYTSRRSASNLQSFNIDEVRKKSSTLEDQAKEKGFSIKFIKNGEFSGNNVSFINYVSLVERIKNSMPHEGRKQEPVKIKPEEYKKRYEKTQKLSQESYTWVAIDIKIGKPIAFTESWFYLNNPEIVIQGDTGVMTTYRGNKLGLTLKYKMLEFLLTSEITKKGQYWTTNNAQSNKHMIAINTELKYKENGIFYVYYLSKENFLKYIERK